MPGALTRTLRRTKAVLIAIHLYSGLALCLLFVTWFISGVAMAYFRTPVIDDAQRLAFAEPIRAGVTLPPERVPGLDADWPDTDLVRLVGWQGRQLYRWRTPAGWHSAWADTGEPASFDAGALAPEAKRWLGSREVEYDGAFEEHSQWSYFTAARDHYPLHRFSTPGPLPRQALFSSRTGEPIVATTFGSRVLYYLGPGVHYYSFYPIRNNDPLWRALVNWSSGIGAVSCLVGLVIGLWQLRWSAIGTSRRVNPYARPWMRWHQWTGLLFGLITFTFVLSGLFSMNPGGIFPSTEIPRQVASAAAGARPSLGDLPDPGHALARVDGVVKELEWKRLRGTPYVVARRDVGHQQMLWARNGAVVLREPFSNDELLASVRGLLPAPVDRVERLTAFDDHYYARKDRVRPLPVLRIRLSDAQATWVYMDPSDGQLILKSDEGTRLRRWLYNGLHSFDVQFLLRRGVWWDVAIWLASLCGLALSVTGCVIAWQWLRRRFPGRLLLPSTRAHADRTPSRPPGLPAR